MGIKRQAKDGHYYEYRRTRGGRFYTVQRGTDEEETKGLIWCFFLMVGILAAPFTMLLSFPVCVVLAAVITRGHW